MWMKYKVLRLRGTHGQVNEWKTRQRIEYFR